MKQFFKSIDLSKVNVNKVIDLAILGMAAFSALAGNTNGALLGIIIFLTGAVLTTKDPK